MVRGQFAGYRNEPGAQSNSQVETYAALVLQIDSWRWSGVPFYIRAGKCLPVTATEVVVDLKPPPVNVFGDLSPEQPNHLRFRLGPDVAIALGAHSKRPGPVMTGQDVELYVAQSQGDGMDAYEGLISAALIGDTDVSSVPIRLFHGADDDTWYTAMEQSIGLKILLSLPFYFSLLRKGNTKLKYNRQFIFVK